MRQIKRLVWHCTQTPSNASVGAILNYWKEKGWKHYGYHKLILPTGDVLDLEPLENPANGARGYNKDSFHFAYLGGSTDYKDWVDTRTDEQKASMKKLTEETKDAYPDIKIMGHCELNKDKECPAFDVKKEFKYLNKKK
jgi:N-acetylmuramoyl-L-alanine amidase